MTSMVCSGMDFFEFSRHISTQQSWSAACLSTGTRLNVLLVLRSADLRYGVSILPPLLAEAEADMSNVDEAPAPG